MPHTTKDIIQSLNFLESVIQQRLHHHQKGNGQAVLDLSKPPAFVEGSLWGNFCMQYVETVEELIVVLLALAPEVQPDFLDKLVEKYLPKSGNFPLFGGVNGKNHRGVIPTGDTALFILAGQNFQRRLIYQEIFSSEHKFASNSILHLEHMGPGEPNMSGRIILDAEIKEQLMTGQISLPKMSLHFPAQHLSSQRRWDDLVLNQHTKSQLAEIKIWINHHDKLMREWGMETVLKPGYRALFYGPPGTGKTMAATLLGKETGREVFRIDLSMVVSKFIGETEKNLANLFDKARNKDWILFFDEADAIFGKRTSVRDSHDKYANQEVSYLLQRIEAFPGLTILASNNKKNIDDAFTRRFQSIIYFPFPKPEERLEIWKKAFPNNKIRFSEDVSLDRIAKKYELTGSNIMNIVQFTCLHALNEDTSVITQQNLERGIAKEFVKEGKTL